MIAAYTSSTEWPPERRLALCVILQALADLRPLEKCGSCVRCRDARSAWEFLCGSAKDWGQSLDLWATLAQISKDRIKRTAWKRIARDKHAACPCHSGAAPRGKPCGAKMNRARALDGVTAVKVE